MESCAQMYRKDNREETHFLPHQIFSPLPMPISQRKMKSRIRFQAFP